MGLLGQLTQLTADQGRWRVSRQLTLPFADYIRYLLPVHFFTVRGSELYFSCWR